ncbi:peptidase inhibitor family I36 protein [Streptomyces sp. NPDC088116]|uniref:peptidase inhibitor family I36 protein n=1 Tax=Streptomyces sp. NPDC088116 TaxID=3365825 RepID=UPI0038222F3F
MHHRVISLAVTVAAVIGCLSVNTASASPVTDTGHAAKTCKKGYFCLWSGPHQTGRLLFAEDAHVTEEGFGFPDRDDIEPPIHPRSAYNPLLDDFGCIVRLNDRPYFQGDEQEVAGFGNQELDGRRVASITSDCG